MSVTLHRPPGPSVGTVLPDWPSVLAVVAHPDDESFGLGAVIDAFVRRGSRVRVLCLTRGEASTLHGVSGDLSALRATELRLAAGRLGAEGAVLKDHPDGHLRPDSAQVLGEIEDEAVAAGAAGLLVFDSSGVTGHLDHVAATAATLQAAAALGLPVLGWTLPAEVAERLRGEVGVRFVGRPPEEIDLVVPVDRSRQVTASLAHGSQAVPSSVLWRRLELLGDLEHLRWLRRA